MKTSFLQEVKLSILAGLFLPTVIFATEFSSTNFMVLDPVIQPGGYSTSDSYRLNGVIGQISIGTSTASSFRANSGFLFFPFVSTPTVTATAGTQQVSLSWTAASGLLGWTVSGYNVGQATVSGGPYTYTSVGNVTSKTVTGLTAGTTYYFVIRPEDAFGNSIATSSEVSAVPTAPAPAPSGGGGGGGGGGGMVTKVVILGRAYPAAAINIFRDGVAIPVPKADLNGNFRADIEVGGGLYTFSIFAIDKDNRRSLTSSFTTNVPSGFVVTLSDIVISPTIGADKSQVKQGNDINFFGYAYPNSQVNTLVNSSHIISATTTSDKFGFWNYILDSDVLEMGDHTAKSQITTPDNMVSPFSESLSFRVGNQDVAFGQLPGLRAPVPVVGVCNKNGDINNDKRVNLVDFSIMLFFWQQRNPSNPCADINQDGSVNLFDFSIMLFWWTG